MRIQLELEDFQFATTRGTDPSFFPEERRWLVLRLAGKTYHVQVLVTQPEHLRPRGMLDLVDRVLVKHMEHMLEYLLLRGAAECPEGAIAERCPAEDSWKKHFDGKCQCNKVEAEVAAH